MIREPLNAEISNPASPVRRFLEGRFSVGLRAVQRCYREGIPPLAVPAAPPGVNPSTLGTAAHWLLRLLLDPQPDLSPAMRGAALCTLADLDIWPAFTDLADRLAVPLPEPGGPARIFTGPTSGNNAEPGLLARACWAFALLTEIYRGGPFVPTHRPRTWFAQATPTGNDLLTLAPPGAVNQLAALHEVFEQALIPHLAQRSGPWALGATFTGSQLLKADADVIAAGLLLDLRISATAPTLSITDIFQLIGCALLDFDDAYRLNSLGLFNARHRYLVTWDLGTLLAELAGVPVDLPALREEFHALLHSHHRADHLLTA